MKFVDEAKIEAQAGKGGDGVAAFRREKFVPKGGPSGGDGGRGGSIYVRASRDINTLLDYRFKRIFRAKNGENGQSKDCYGRSGNDLYLEVPMGTIIYDEADNSVIFDLSQDGQTEQLCKGGKGGARQYTLQVEHQPCAEAVHQWRTRRNQDDSYGA